jgi:hypothetical protein
VGYVAVYIYQNRWSALECVAADVRAHLKDRERAQCCVKDKWSCFVCGCETWSVTGLAYLGVWC